MEEQIMRKGASYGALFLKIGIPALLFLLLMLPVLGLFIIFFADDNSTGGINGGQPSEYALENVPAEYMPIYQAAAKKYNVPWNLLAAHHRVETVFGTNKKESYAGAQGDMQFMPCTWLGWAYPACGGLGDLDLSAGAMSDPAKIKKYGGFGVDGDGDGKADINNTVDSIFSAAYYLAANGADEGMIEKAVFAYNHSEKYVEDVLHFASLYASVETVSGSGKWPVPFTQNITSHFGWRIHPVTGGKSFHNGTDFAAGGIMGKPAVAILPGKVKEAGRKGTYGNAVVIKHANGLETLYGHLSSIKVSKGQTVEPGVVVGLVGSTGRSTGAHLHFKVSQNGTDINPMKILP